MEEEIIIIITPPPLGPDGATIASTGAPDARFYGRVTRETLLAAQRAISARLAEFARTVDEE